MKDSKIERNLLDKDAGEFEKMYQENKEKQILVKKTQR